MTEILLVILGACLFASGIGLIAIGLLLFNVAFRNNAKLAALIGLLGVIGGGSALFCCYLISQPSLILALR